MIMKIKKVKAEYHIPVTISYKEATAKTIFHLPRLSNSLIFLHGTDEARINGLLTANPSLNRLIAFGSRDETEN